MNIRNRLIALAALLVASPAAAERLEFDFRLYPPLRDVVDGNDKGKIGFDATNPARVVDVFAIKGKSAEEWTEAVEIVALKKPARSGNIAEWMNRIGRDAAQRCPSGSSAVIAQDAGSITFERRAPGCSDKAPFGIYRLVAGKRSWFQLAVLAKEDLDPAAREQWLALLASAHLAP